jgi:hypothetical protein
MTIRLLKYPAEVGQVFEAAAKGHLANTFLARIEQQFCMLQSFLSKPFAGGGLAILEKLLFKGRDAAMCHAGKLGY